MGPIVLGLLGIAFVAFGTGYVVDPSGMAEILGVGLEMPTPAARADVRAIYGGLEAGIGFFLLACARRPEWVLPGLLAAGYALGFIACARLAGIMRDGATDGMTLLAFALELASTGLAALAYRQESGTKA